jgi:hypothetical protein
VPTRVEFSPAVPAVERQTGGTSRPPRVLVVFESSPGGRAALREAAQVGGGETHLTVVALAPQSVASRCCARGPSVEVVNCVVREEAEDDLLEAREILGDAADRATFKALVGKRDPPIGKWAVANSFDLIVLPSRRLSIGGHPLARALRRTTTAEVRLAG